MEHLPHAIARTLLELGRAKNRRATLAVATAVALLVPAGQPLRAQSDAKTTKEVLGVYSTVMAKAYPPAGAVLKGMTELMDMLGFFDEPDPLRSINARLDALQEQITRLAAEIALVRGDALRERNQQRIWRLRDSRQQLKAIVAALAQHPADPAVKALLVNQAQAEAEKFLDLELWSWSDLALKDHQWPGRDGRVRPVAAGTMLDPDFKPMPTLEYYTAALMIWGVAIEQATGGNAGLVQQTYGAPLQEHIAFLSRRPGWRDGVDAAQTLPEQIAVRVRGLYEPERFPVKRVCTIHEYLADDLARQVTYVHDLTSTSATDNELCNVPEGLRTRATAAEENFERDYGTAVMTRLAEKLKHLKDRGNMRESFTGTFDPTYYALETVYAVKPDGDLVWQRHRVATSRTPVTPALASGPIVRSRPTGPIGGGRPTDAIPVVGKPVEEYSPFNVERPKTVGTGWGFKRVFADSLGVIYVINGAGALGWYRHLGYPQGDGLENASAWTAPKEVGIGWGDFPHVFAAGDGVIYTLDGQGQLRWYKHDGHLTGAGLETPGAWAYRTSQIVQTGWTDVRLVFSGGKGVIYVVTHDGRLLWYRHSAYLNSPPHPIAVPPSRPRNVIDGFRSQWERSWEGPKEVGQGWDFSHVFSAGTGGIYAVTADGKLRWYKHLGYDAGEPLWWRDAATGLQYREIASGWGDALHAFAVLPGAPPPNSGPR